jgi:hypothetical protein
MEHKGIADFTQQLPEVLDRFKQELDQNLAAYEHDHGADDRETGRQEDFGELIHCAAKP